MLTFPLICSRLRDNFEHPYNVPIEGAQPTPLQEYCAVVSIEKEEKDAHINSMDRIADFTELPIPYPQQTVSVRERTLKTDPLFVENVMKGVVGGNNLNMDPRNKERVKQLIAKYLRLDRVEKAEEHYQSALKVMAPKPYIDVAGITSMIEFIAESDPLVAKVKPEMVINHSILKKLDNRGSSSKPHAARSVSFVAQIWGETSSVLYPRAALPANCFESSSAVCRCSRPERLPAHSPNQ